LKELTGKPCSKPHELLERLGIDNLPNEALSLKLQKTYAYYHPISEAQVLNLEKSSPESLASISILILALLYGKWRGIKQDVGFAYVANHAGSELWAGIILPYLDSWLEKETSWDASFRTILETFILDQHDRIMYEKRRLDSCWLHRTEGRILKDQDYEPAWRSSRHINSVKILSDLGFLEISTDGLISITSDGKKILKGIE
jgi:hypothetical protein